MQVILREDVANLGETGQVVRVRDGYGRNYLIPRGLAVVASDRNRTQTDHERRVIAKRNEKRMAEAASLCKRIEALSINIAKAVGEEGKLFGSVTTREIAEAIMAQGINVDRKSIHLDEPIKSLGVHKATVRLGPGVSAEFKVWVVEQ